METNIKPTVEKIKKTIDKEALAVLKTVKQIAVKTKQIIKK